MNMLDVFKIQERGKIKTAREIIKYMSCRIAFTLEACEFFC